MQKKFSAKVSLETALNVFVSLKSMMSMSSVRQEAEVIDEEIMRL